MWQNVETQPLADVYDLPANVIIRVHTLPAHRLRQNSHLHREHQIESSYFRSLLFLLNQK